MSRKPPRIAALRGERYFRWRGGDVSRLESLTDAVFALAMTLLIVSLEVPGDFDELLASFRQVPAFAICFALLGMCWFYHYQFHRRFGLESFYTMLLNSALLFLVLLYVYPLKFLFSKLVDGLIFGERVEMRGGTTLMVLYSGGVVGIFLLYTLMYLHAWRHRDALALTEVERLVTRASIREHVIHMSIGMLSIVLAVTVHPALAGLVYFLVGPTQFLNGWISGRAIERRAAAISHGAA